MPKQDTEYVGIPHTWGVMSLNCGVWDVRVWVMCVFILQRLDPISGTITARICIVEHSLTAAAAVAMVQLAHPHTHTHTHPHTHTHAHIHTQIFIEPNPPTSLFVNKKGWVLRQALAHVR